MIIIAIIINLIIAAWLYPEIFVRMDFRLVQGHETCGPMQYVFYLIGQFYQGSIQLYNHYDLLNGSFTQLSVGLYTPLNFLIALGYVLLVPFSDAPGEFFHHWYLITYYGLGLALRTFGTYILAYYITQSRLTSVLTTILVNAFCALTLIHMGGMCIAQVYNFLPLILFCLVYYWDSRNPKVILVGLLTFLLAANSSLYVGLGYFYQTIHLFIFDMFVIWLLFQRKKKPLLIGQFQIKECILTIGACLLILLPVLFWATNLFNEYEVADSGLGESKGRFERILNPPAMLNDTKRSFVSSAQVWSHSYDFTTSGWYLSGAFVGILVMVLAMTGLILGRHNYKFVFISAAVMMGFLNVPSTQGGWMMWAHWVDAITNPFCFLVRSFHYSVLLWYLTLAIPVCMGLAACIALIKKETSKYHHERILIVVGILSACWIGAFYLPQEALRLYALGVIGLMLIFFAITAWPTGKWDVFRPWALALVIVVLTVVEFSVLRTYLNTKSVDMNEAYWDGMRIKPRVFGPMHTPPIPMVLDYQNPKILPVRFFYRTDDQVIFPLMQEFQGMFGQFYRYMPLVLRLERPSGMYVPRFKIFKGIDTNLEMQEYLRRDGRIMFVADAVIAPQEGVLRKLLNANTDRRIVQIEGAHDDRRVPFDSIKLDPNGAVETFKQNVYDFDFAQSTVKHLPQGDRWSWRLPKQFASYLSSAVMTPDAGLWRLQIEGKQLVVAQGALVTPGTFDVNNVRDGYLTVLMPKGQVQAQGKVQLSVITPEALVDVWRNRQDEFGFTYKNPRDGFWVIHRAYDPKWELFIDGVKTPLARVNGYFMGAPLSKGEHQIYLTYWPNSPLRYLIPLSVIVCFAVFIWVIINVLAWYKRKV